MTDPKKPSTNPTEILPDGFQPAVWTPESRKAHRDLVLKAINDNPDSTTASPKIKSTPWTPEEGKAHGEAMVAAMKAGLAKRGIK